VTANRVLILENRETGEPVRANLSESRDFFPFDSATHHAQWYAPEAELLALRRENEALRARGALQSTELTDEDVAAMRKALATKLRSPVWSVNEFESILRKYVDVANDYLVEQGYLKDEYQADRLFLAADKSNLLARMFYGGEQPRTTPCPECKGHWRGCFLKCPCGGCGWVKDA